VNEYRDEDDESLIERGFGCVLCGEAVHTSYPSREMAVWIPNDQSRSGNDWVCEDCVIGILQLDDRDAFLEFMSDDDFQWTEGGPIPIINLLEAGLKKQIVDPNALDIIEALSTLGFTSDTLIQVGNALSRDILQQLDAPSIIDKIHSIEDILRRLGTD